MREVLTECGYPRRKTFVFKAVVHTAEEWSQLPRFDVTSPCAELPCKFCLLQCIACTRNNKRLVVLRRPNSRRHPARSRSEKFAERTTHWQIASTSLRTQASSSSVAGMPAFRSRTR